jgi:phosphoglycolate phosphatase-like HAD superfamily hydrolase
VDLPDAELFVLDLDGTVVDLPVDWDALRRELHAELERRGVVTRERGVFGILAELQRSGETATFVACSDIVRAAELEAAPSGAVNRALLDRLPDGAPLGILSLNSNQAVHAALRDVALPGPVVATVGREDVLAPKPDPSGIDRILEVAGVPRERAVMIGDSPGDLDTAQAAHVRGIDVEDVGVRWVPR